MKPGQLQVEIRTIPISPDTLGTSGTTGDEYKEGLGPRFLEVCILMARETFSSKQHLKINWLLCRLLGKSRIKKLHKVLQKMAYLRGAKQHI